MSLTLRDQLETLHSIMCEHLADEGPWVGKGYVYHWTDRVNLALVRLDELEDRLAMLEGREEDQ